MRWVVVTMALVSCRARDDMKGVLVAADGSLGRRFVLVCVEGRHSRILVVR